MANTVYADSFGIFQVNGGLNGFGGGVNLQQFNVFGCAPNVLIPENYYQSGAGCPAVSTADALYTNGVYGVRPYDLTNAACGSVGASVAASKGRYIWVIGPDHNTGPVWNDGYDIYVGYSNDPGVLPKTVTSIIRGNATANFATATFTGSITSNVLTAAATVTGRIVYQGNQTLTGTGVSTTVGNPISGNASIGKDGTYNATNANVSSRSLTQTQTNVNPDYFPYFVCNPDSTSEAFLIYLQVSAGGGNSFETGAIYASDPTAGWTFGGPTHISPNGSFEYVQQVVRTGANAWKSLGISGWPTNSTVAYQLWTATDPITNWDTNGTQINSCLPAISPPNVNGCANGSSNFIYSTAAPDGITTTVGAQNYILSREDSNLISNSNQGQYVSLVPVDSGYNAISSPAVIRLSNQYAGFYPGPTFLQTATGGYIEDGVEYIYAQVGMFACLNIPACSTSPSPPYNPSNPLLGGGLWQQKIDRYCHVIDSAAALNAAPSGVAASAAAGVVTLSWDNCRPNQTYRVYWGTSPNSMPNVLPDVNGLTTTHTPYLQVPQTLYYKVVSISSGTEEKSRTVSTYISSSSKFVNQHETRVLAAGADPATVDRSWLDSVDALLTAQGLQNNLRTWEDPSFGVIQDRSGNVSKAFDLGTTRLPRGGDLTFCSNSPCTGASTATYNPTAFGTPGTTPGIVNPSSAGYSYFGSGRINSLRRMVNVSVCAAYSKPGTALASLVTYGANDLNQLMNLQHTAGTPGNASFTLYDGTTTATVTSAMSLATGPHVICGTFDTTGATSPSQHGTLKVYADGVVTGSPDTSLVSNIDLSINTTLKGALDGSNTSPVLAAGATSIKASTANDGTGPVTAPSYVYEDDHGNFTNGGIMVFDVALTQAQVQAITDAYLHRFNPPTAIAYNITSAPYSATCNGIADDSAAFNAWYADALAWDIAHPSTTGSIVLNLPNSTCLNSTGSNVFLAKGIVNPSGYPGQQRLRVIGAGTSSALSDGGTGAGFTLGGPGLPNGLDGMGNPTTALVSTVSKGSATLNFTACPGAGCAAALALFSPGARVLLTGIDLGPPGNPPNPGFWDFLTIATVTATGVTTTTPITHNYESTWPSYSTASNLAPNQGGPATLYTLDPAWPVTVEYNQVNLNQTAGPGGGTIPGKAIVIKNSTISGTATCEGPSLNELFAWVKTTMTSCIVEVDKIINTFIAQNVSAIAHIDFQSASVKQFIASEVNATTYLEAGGVNNVVANSVISELKFGPHSFGATTGVSQIIGNSITTLTSAGASSSGSGVGVNTLGTWSGGTWSITISDMQMLSGGNSQPNWIEPGANMFFASGSGAGTLGPVLQVADIAASGSCMSSCTLSISFNQNGSPYGGGFPTMPGSIVQMHAHSAPQLFASGNSGSADAADINGTPPGAPLWSYSKRTYTGSNPGVVVPVWGQFSTVNMTPGTLYTGSSLSFDLNTALRTLNSSAALSNYLPSINTKFAGKRTMTATTTSGAQSGDSISAPGAGVNAWFPNDQTVPCFWNGSACAVPGDIGSTSVTFEIITNQGVVNPP